MRVQRVIGGSALDDAIISVSPTPHTMYPGDLQVESRISAAVRADLLQRGHKLYVTGAYSIGSNAAIAADSAKGVISAGADPRVGAFAVAW